ncbi:MAG: pyruvate kinase, partial [Planctomycetota bacterium]
GYENVPVLQKEIIQKSIALARPVIVATQMLDSMIEHPRPTRAEASDVANAIYECADAVMLSGETAIGAFPVESARTMAKIICRIEDDISRKGRERVMCHDKIRHEGAIAEAAVSAAASIGAKCIVPFTTSGRTARLVSRERPATPIISFGESVEAMRRLCFYWGVRPRILQTADSMNEHFRHGERELLKNRDVAPGDYVIFLAGLLKMQGATNTLRIHRIQDH